MQAPSFHWELIYPQSMGQVFVIAFNFKRYYWLLQQSLQEQQVQFKIRDAQEKLIILIRKQKMRGGIFIGLFLALLPVASLSFPPNKWAQYTPTIAIPNLMVVESQIQTVGSLVILYTSMIDQSYSQFVLQKINANAFRLTITSFTSGPFLTLMNNELILSYSQSSGRHLLLRMNKTDLTVVEKSITENAIRGVYLSNMDILVIHENVQYVKFSPELINTTETNRYHSGTSDVYSTQYLFTRDQTQLFSFYSDVPFYIQRSLSPDSDLKTSFPVVEVTQTYHKGYQCSCLNADDTLLYYLLLSGSLQIFDTALKAKVGAILTGYTGITQCYFDSINNGIVMASEKALDSYHSGTVFKFFSLSSNTETNSFSVLQFSFKADSVAEFGTTSFKNTVFIYTLASSCTDPEYYDPSSRLCQTCPTECLACKSNEYCTSCQTDFTLDESNICSQTGTRSADSAANATLLLTTLSYLMNNAAVSNLNQAPGGRKVLPFLCFLISLDELWLYQYHEADYGTTMSQFFGDLQTLETEKWLLLSEKRAEAVYTALGTSRESLTEFIDTKRDYTHPKFLASEGKGETFLPACWDFLTFNLVFILLGYFMLRVVFRLLSRYKVSIFLRAFSFLIYLAPLLLDGNLQYFFFLMFAQHNLAFSLNFRDKALNVVSLLLYFAVLWMAVVSAFFAYYLSRKLAKYVLDNWRSRLHGLISYSISNALRMLVFGAIHSLLRHDPSLQLTCLAAAEGTYFLLLCLAMKAWKAHKVEFKLWFSLAFSLLRICLQVTLYAQLSASSVGTGSDLQALFESILGVLLNLYMLTFYVGTATEIVYEVLQLFKPHKLVLSPQKVNKVKLAKKQQVSSCLVKDINPLSHSPGKKVVRFKTLTEVSESRQMRGKTSKQIIGATCVFTEDNSSKQQ